MFADKHIQNIALVVQVSGGHGDELAVPGRDGVLRCPGQQSVRFCGDQRGSNEQLRCAGCPGAVANLCCCCRVAADHSVKQVVDLVGHE